MVRLAAFALLALGVSSLSPTTSPAQGKFNRVLKVGDAAPVWADLPGVDGKKHGLADLTGKDAVVFIITCNHCPMAVAYEDRIISFTKKYSSKPVQVVAVNVNTGPEDSLPAMKTRAKGKAFNFPYAFDASQKIGKSYGATRTPEFYVIGKDRKIVYMGSLDDNEDPTLAKRNYVEEAVDAVLAGKTPAVTETAARGCGVRYN
jgi:peroxiredoxin